MLRRHTKPVIPVLHHMARSGGTLICKCIGSMENIVLLSEVHPAGMHHINPLDQAMRWYNLLTPSDCRKIHVRRSLPFKKLRTYRFNDAISMIHKRCQEQGKTLVIRDWSHLDFTAIPFLPEPTYRLTTAEVLSERFDVTHYATVRHPIDQWLSLRIRKGMLNKITLDVFLRGYLRFAEHSVRIGFMRYEDFTRSPDTELQTLCDRLGIQFDPSYKMRWSSYTNITGDDTIRDRAESEIKAPTRRETEPRLLDEFANNADYLRAIELLGYSHQ